MAVIKTLKGQTVVTVVWNIVYPDPPPSPPPEPEEDTFIHHIHKMASAWRVVAFFFVVFVIPVVLIALPLYARYTLYPARSLALVEADTVDLHAMASSFWCQGQRMSSNGTFDAYLLPHAPKLNEKRRRLTTAANILQIVEDEPQARMVHLLKGSSLTLNVCARWPGGTIIVVQGKSNFQRCFYEESVDLDDIFESEGEKREHRMEEINRRRRKSEATFTGVLPISETDVMGSSDDDAREMFDDSDDAMPRSVGHKETWPQETSSSNSDSGRKIRDSHYKTKAPTKYSSYTSPLSSNNNENINVIEDVTVGNKSKIMRVLRSIVSRNHPEDSSYEKRKRDEEEARKFGLLHSVNDPRDVTAGNSSVSSSEEFMQHCVDTILNIDVSSFVDCQTKNLSLDPEWNFRINETDDYYIILMSDNSLEENVMQYYLKLDRVMYNVSSNKDTCSNITECSFPLHFMGFEAVVVEMSGQDSSEEVLHDLGSYEMQTVCQPRVAVYMVFILMVPFIILMFAFQ